MPTLRMDGEAAGIAFSEVNWSRVESLMRSAKEKGFVRGNVPHIGGWADGAFRWYMETAFDVIPTFPRFMAATNRTGRVRIYLQWNANHRPIPPAILSFIEEFWREMGLALNTNIYYDIEGMSSDTFPVTPEPLKGPVYE